jgi:hypothetical protein
MYKLLGKLPRRTGSPRRIRPVADWQLFFSVRSSRGAILTSTSFVSSCENAGYENKY